MDEDVLRQLRTYFEAHPAGLAAVYLYGSIARGDAHAGSDVDVGVLFAGDPPSTFVAQPYELEAALEDRIRRPVQVVILNRAPVDLRARVLRDGEIVFEPDRAGRIRFEVQTRNEAFDLEPILRRYRMPRRPIPTSSRRSWRRSRAAWPICDALANPARLEHDVREERFVEHTLQVAILDAIDIASHILSDLRLGEPRTNRALVELLERGGVLAAPLASTLGNMVGFRNVIVHGYDPVDLAVVRDVLEHRLDDLLTFVGAVRARL